VGSFEGFTQSNKTLRACFSFCRSYCNSSWKLSRGISQIKLSEIFESYLKFFEIIGRNVYLSLLMYRLMFLNRNPEHVLHSLQTTIHDLMQQCRSGISITTYLLGLLAFFLTANTLFITLQG
jgi:hypothetical protein